MLFRSRGTPGEGSGCGSRPPPGPVRRNTVRGSTRCGEVDDTRGGAYDELATDGRAGELTREVLTEVVLEVAGRRGFVPPAPHLAWGRLVARQHARQDLELLRTGFLMAAWTRAHDEASLRVVLTHEVERQLEVRATGWPLPVLDRKSVV